MKIFIIRLSNVIAWFGFIYFICVTAYVATAGIEKLSFVKSAYCGELSKGVELNGLSSLSDDDFITYLRCPNKGKTETMQSIGAWFFGRSLLYIPFAMVIILNYLLVGRFRLLPWKKLDEAVKPNAQI